MQNIIFSSLVLFFIEVRPFIEQNTNDVKSSVSILRNDRHRRVVKLDVLKCSILQDKTEVMKWFQMA